MMSCVLVVGRDELCISGGKHVVIACVISGGKHVVMSCVLVVHGQVTPQ